MVLELHTWGPAFDLPSIDAQCLATIYYLQNVLGRPGEAWVLIPSSDPRVSPLGELPALRDAETWVAGFSNITAYLRDVSNGEWDLDRSLDEAQRADRAAFTSFVEFHGEPLLDLSLYVSSDNYLDRTRQALAEILSWPNSWTVPHRLRERAKKRSEHLGLSSLDVDTAQQDKSEETGLTAHIPKSLRKPKLTVSGLLGRGVQKNKFRLDAITADFFEPVMELLGDKTYLLGDEESSLDCLVLGYLALMQRPQLPQGWVRDALRTKYAKLGHWAEARITTAFNEPIDFALIMGRKTGTPETRLPPAGFQAPQERSLSQVLQSVVEGCISSIPVFGSGFGVSEIGSIQTARRDRYREKQLRLARLQHRRDMYVQILASTFAITGLLGWLGYKGILQLPRRAPQGRRFGEAGALFGLV
ncbi:hypothetical protein LTR67_010083 [Exophiala xenobiotica]|jgi:sorting and assembly machinery component 37